MLALPAEPAAGAVPPAPLVGVPACPDVVPAVGLPPCPALALVPAVGAVPAVVLVPAMPFGGPPASLQ